MLARWPGHGAGRGRRLMDLASATWTDLAPGQAGPGAHDTLLVPLGATEQHGPHLPFATDTVIAIGVARAAAERASGLVVAPALVFGASGEHQGFPGTLSIGHDALLVVLVELGRSAARTFARTVFVCGHGGNMPTVKQAADQLCGEGRPTIGWFPAVAGGDAHAGRTETSLMLALAPEAVRPARPVGNRAPLAELLDGLQRDGLRPHAPDGVLGDATGASAVEGRRILDGLVETLLALLLTGAGASSVRRR